MTESTKLAAYLRLLRLHQRTGVWLLMWPCWWSVALASLGATPLGTLMLFLLGAAVMRPAGCIINDMADREMPIEVRSLAGTLRRWRNQIIAWHRARVSNGPTEALNNLIKRIKRVAFGMRTFRHYRIRILLYAGHPNWDLLTTITPR